jgi:hypothetical protein
MERPAAIVKRSTMTCAFCQADHAESAKICQSCGLPINTEPTLALVPPATVVKTDTTSHPFAHPKRTKFIKGIKNAMTALLIVPVMSIIGGIIAVVFFALVIGVLDHLYFHPILSQSYLAMLARKSLLAGLFVGIPTGAFGALAAAGALIRNAGKILPLFCLVIALPFLIFPPWHFFPHVMRISSPYNLPPGIMGGFLLALPFLAFMKVFHTMFVNALASRR